MLGVDICLSEITLLELKQNAPPVSVGTEGWWCCWVQDSRNSAVRLLLPEGPNLSVLGLRMGGEMRWAKQSARNCLRQSLFP